MLEAEENTAGGGKSVAFVTFGCRLNRAETEELEEKHAAAGWRITGADRRGRPPDLIVVRGCSVTAKAQRDCEKAIARLRMEFPQSEIKIAGCLPGSVKIEAPPAPHLATLNPKSSRTHLKVQDGCSGRCAFCIVPAFRGAPSSVPFRDAVAKAGSLIGAGYREIVLTGCNLCLYRDGKRRLPDLAAAIAGIESHGHRVRLGSVEPGLCDRALADALASHANICRFLHISLQSGSDGVLRRMRRPYNIAQAAALCEAAARAAGPRMTFGADVISGFPGETEADHRDTIGFLRSFDFAHVHPFAYSERPGTEAATMEGRIPVAERRRRAEEVRLAGAENRDRIASRLAGEDVEVCVERGGRGRTDEYFKCALEGHVPRRSLVRAKVLSYSPATGTLSAAIR